MSGGTGGGGGGGSSTSTPLTAAQRTELFNAGATALSPFVGSWGAAPSYTGGTTGTPSNPVTDPATGSTAPTPPPAFNWEAPRTDYYYDNGGDAPAQGYRQNGYTYDGNGNLMPGQYNYDVATAANSGGALPAVTPPTGTPVATAAGNFYINPALNYQTPQYRDAPVYDPGAAQQLSGGNYDALQQSLLSSRIAPLAQAFNQESQRVDADMAKRGIWSSGAATRGQMDLQDKFAPLLLQAANDAAVQRYNLQANDLNALNNYNLARANDLTSGSNASAGMYNQFGLNTSGQRLNAAWQPANYFKDIWNGTGGTVSTTNTNSSDGGWNFMI